MEDEIKEIINDLQRVADRKCYPEDILCGSIAQEWVDYITNLQEELKNTQEKWEKDKQFSKCRTMEMLDYKSRCEKAIEYLNYNDETLYTFEPDYDYEENIVDNYEPSSYREDLLNILQGSAKE